MTSRQQIIPVQLPDQVKIQVEATVLGGEEDVSFRVQSFQGVIDAIESIAASMEEGQHSVRHPLLQNCTRTLTFPDLP